jgi:hypothetical protein
MPPIPLRCWIVGVAVLALLSAYLGWQGGRDERSLGAVHLTISLPAGKVTQQLV